MAQTTPSSPDEEAPASDAPDQEVTSIKDSFRAALARKSGQNSHVEQHLGKKGVGSGVNDTHKRQFRRKSGG